MKGETLDCFAFLLGYVEVLIDAAPVLWKLFLRDLVLSLKIIPWAASNSL